MTLRRPETVPEELRGRCRTHIEAVVNYTGGAEVCGDYGGLNSTGGRCLHPAGWGFADATTGPCRTHLILEEGAEPPNDTPLPDQPPPSVPDPGGDPRVYVIEHVIRNFPGVTNWVNANQTMEIGADFRDGRSSHDYIVASIANGTINQTAPLRWEVASPVSTIATLQFFRDMIDRQGVSKVVSYKLHIRIPVGPPTSVVVPTYMYDGTNRADDLQAWLEDLDDETIVETPEGVSNRIRADYKTAGGGLELIDRWGIQLTGPTTIYTDYDANYYGGSNLAGYLEKNPELDQARATDIRRKNWKHWRIQRGGDFYSSWGVEGPRPANSTRYDEKERDTQHAYLLEGVNGATFEDLTLRDVWGDFFTLASEPIEQNPTAFRNKFGDGLFHQAPSRSVVVRGLTAINTGRQAVGATGIEGLLMEDSTFDKVQRSLLDMEPSGGHLWSRDLIFRDLTIGQVRNTVANTAGNGEFMENFLFQRILMNNTGFDFRLAGHKERRNITVEDCVSVIRSSGNYMMDIGNWGGTVTITGCSGIHNDATQRPAGSAPGSGGPRIQRPAINAENCPATMVVSGNTWREQKTASAGFTPYPLEYRQTVYVDNSKANPVCRIVEKQQAGSPVTLFDSGACD
jgi:hypothetical protein